MMRKLLAILLLIASVPAVAAWGVGKGQYAWADTYMQPPFDAVNLTLFPCDPVMVSLEFPEILTDKEVVVALVVDNNFKGTITLEGGEDGIYGAEVYREILAPLMYGSVAHLVFSEGNIMEFSLKGSGRAIRKAMSLCKYE